MWVRGAVVFTALILPACKDATLKPSSTDVSVASLTPVVTATIRALGAGDRLVAVTDYCPRVEGAEIPAVGTALTPNFEALVRARPSVIILEQNKAAKEDALARIAPTVSLPWSSVAKAAASIRRLGELLNRRPAAEALATRFETELDVPERSDGPRVLMLLAGPGDRLTSLWYLRPRSIHGSALTAAGGRHAVEEPVGPPHLGLEDLIRIDPPVLFILGRERADVDAMVTALESIDVLTAVKTGRLEVFTGPDLLSTGPSVLDVIPKFAAALGRTPSR